MAAATEVLIPAWIVASITEELTLRSGPAAEAAVTPARTERRRLGWPTASGAPAIEEEL